MRALTALTALTAFTRIATKPPTFQNIRTVTTTRYVKLARKDMGTSTITTPKTSKTRTTKTSGKSAATTAEAKPTESVLETVQKSELKKAAAAEPALANAIHADHFPTTKQFDSSFDDEVKENAIDWSTSFHGLSTVRFPKEVTDILLEPVNSEDIEIKPDGLIYLPEIKYRRILNRAFGPGGWGLAPRGEHTISPKNISREYALICNGRFVSQARGEQDFFDVSGLPTASEGCKSNALMRCCKDLGIASELWDPVFIRKFKKKYCVEVWTEHVTTKKRKKLWKKKDDTLEYPYKEV